MTAVRITAGSEQVWNFCYKIKTFHEKRGEQQFYDFTIKDKDGVGIQAHKFILASQSEYFACLFRVHPTASETTFKDFSLDVIKSSIEYLYTHEVNLTGSNVQDVLTFADFINLTDVTDVCTRYIISNIDESNYARVMELGNSRGLDQLVESAVLFVVRNLSVSQCVSSQRMNFDDFTKQMIMKVARWQQQRPTIVTKEQWRITQLKNRLMSTPKEEMVLQFRCSSVYGENPTNWGPHLAANGKISNNDIHYYHSAKEMQPWLEVRLPSPILISSLTIINRQNACWDRLRNLEIRAGMEAVPEGFTVSIRGCDGDKKLEVNSLCGYFAGPAQRSAEGPVIMFNQPVLAQYITLQILEVGYLQINGLKINGGSLLNYEDLLEIDLQCEQENNIE